MRELDFIMRAAQRRLHEDFKTEAALHGKQLKNADVPEIEMTEEQKLRAEDAIKIAQTRVKARIKHG